MRLTSDYSFNGLRSWNFIINVIVVNPFQLPHKHKIVIAGNHELGFDPKNTVSQFINNRSGHIGDSPQCGNVDIKNLRETSTEPDLIAEDMKKLRTEDTTEYNIRQELTNCTYLEDSAVTIAGLKIYGE